MATKKQKASTYLPEIDSDQRAIDLMHNGAYGATFTAALTAVTAIVAMYQGHPVLGTEGSGLLDAAIFTLIAWRIYRLSLPWAIAGFLIFLGEKIYGTVAMPKSAISGIILIFVFSMLYVNAIRGGFHLRRRRNTSDLLTPTLSTE